MDIYGFEVSEALVTDVTNKILPEIESWQKRPLCAVYPIVYIDAIVFNVRDNGIIRKQAAYVILGEGHIRALRGWTYRNRRRYSGSLPDD